MKKHGPTKGKSGKFSAAEKVSITLGRERFGKISKVEGIELSGDMRRRAAEFDRRGSSTEERRSTIIRAYRKD